MALFTKPRTPNGRYYYKPVVVMIDGEVIPNVVVTEICTNFKLVQTFCSCGGLKLAPKGYEYHYSSCSNAKGRLPRGYVDKNGNDVFPWICGWMSGSFVWG